MLLDLCRNWWALALRGVCAILFGIAAFVWPGITLAAFILVWGAFAIVDGIFAIIGALRGPLRDQSWWALLLAGVVSLAAGVMAFLWPGITALAFLYLIAFWAIVRGIFEIAAAIQLRKVIDNEWLLALAGLASIGLGVLLAAAPGAGILALLWMVGAFSIVLGVLTLMLAFRLRSVRDRLTHGTPQMA